MSENESKTKEQQLQDEAKRFYELAKEYRRERYMNDESHAYILNKKWLAQWKEYVNYSHIKKNLQYSYYYSKVSSKQYEPKLDKHPGPIDNSELLVPLNEFLNDGDPNNQDNYVFREDIDKAKDIRIVNQKIWNFFKELYGGGPEIIRKAIDETPGRSYGKKIIELVFKKISFYYLPLRSNLQNNTANLNEQIYTMYISRICKLSEVKGKMLALLTPQAPELANLTAKNLRLWKINFPLSARELFQTIRDKQNETDGLSKPIKIDNISYLEYQDSAVCETDLADNDTVIVETIQQDNLLFELPKIEVKEGRCEWCNQEKKMLRFFCTCKEVWYCSEVCKLRDENYHSKSCKKKFEIEESQLKASDDSKGGLVGLQNLGNTCFMNTSLQCLSNCAELTEYFLKNHYVKDINTDNPIGTGGVLCRAYANLLKNLWYGTASVFSPWNFKRAISTFQSMFSGYQQHDTQEFLNYLLDGLHEDVNRVIKKPLVEKDERRLEDEVKSKEQWIGFLRRNQSILVDLFYGQFKSTLYCPDQNCQNISTTFDPFLSMSLPLVPKIEPYEIKCYFIFHDIRIKPIQLVVPFSVDTTIMALRNKISKILKVHPFSFFILKMDQGASIDHILHSTALIKTNSYFDSNNKPFFLFQIDPKLFYSRDNKYIIQNPELLNEEHHFENTWKGIHDREDEIKQLLSEDYEEDESGSTSESVCYYSFYYAQSLSGRSKAIMRINTDENMGFNNNYIKIVINLTRYDNDDAFNNFKRRIIFPRIIYADKRWTTAEFHRRIFSYFYPLLAEKFNLDDSQEEMLWNKLYGDISTEVDSKKEHLEKNYPYRIRLKNNFSQNNRMYSQCYFCDNNCNDCLFPYSDTITIQDIVNKVPKNDELDIDNTYLYLNHKQKYYSSNSNKDIALELVWLPEYHDTVHKLNDKEDVKYKAQKTYRDKTISLNECFKNFMKLEKLDETNEWYCPECKTHQRATKKMEIYKTPHILIIHLKRFKNNQKIDNLVDFPINSLDLSSYVIADDPNLSPIYDLFAIANHYGSMGFGHYISYAKSPINKRWYEFDDSHVSAKTEMDLVTSSAYVLFYRRRGLEKLNMEQLYTKTFVNYEEILKNGSTTPEAEAEDEPMAPITDK